MIVIGYPNVPGWKAQDTETSARAAILETERAEVVREQVLRILHRYDNCTADEAATFLGLSVLAVRPRFSELKAQGRIEKTTQRRKNPSGHTAVAWRASGKLEQMELAENKHNVVTNYMYQIPQRRCNVRFGRDQSRNVGSTVAMTSSSTAK